MQEATLYTTEDLVLFKKIIAAMVHGNGFSCPDVKILVADPYVTMVNQGSFLEHAYLRIEVSLYTKDERKVQVTKVVSAEAVESVDIKYLAKHLSKGIIQNLVEVTGNIKSYTLDEEYDWMERYGVI